MLPVLTRSDPHHPLKNTAHRAHAAEAALLRDLLEAARGFLQTPPRGLDPQALDEFSGRDAQLAPENAGKVSRAHGHVLRESLHGERLAEILEHPGLQLAQGLA